MLVVRLRLALLALLLHACSSTRSTYVPAELLAAEIDRTSGRSLIVSARQLPLGERCELRLSGRALRAGQAFALHESIPCRRLDRLTVSADLEASEVASDAPLTFVGAIEVAVRTPGGESRARFAPLHLRFPGTAHGELHAARTARVFQHAIGILELEASAEGVVVHELAPHGVAALAGLRPGDLIERNANVPVESAVEIAAATHTGRVRLDVRREGVRPQRFHVELAPASDGHPLPVLLVLLAVGALSGWMLPAFAPLLSDPERTRRAGVLALLTLALFALHALAVPIDLRLLWLPCALLHAASSARAYARGRASTASLSRALLALAIATLAACGLAFASAARDSLLPWRWTLSSSPAAWLSAWVLARAALFSPRDRAQGLQQWTSSAVCASHTLLLAWYGLDAAALLRTGELLSPPLRAACFVAELALAYYLLDRLRRLDGPRWLEIACALFAPLLALLLAQLLAHSGGTFAPVSSALGLLSCGLVSGRWLRTFVARARACTGDHDLTLDAIA